MVGLQWENVGSAPPIGGAEVRNEALGFALRNKLHFSAAELNSMGATNLGYNNYVRASKLSNDRNTRQIERYFRPVSTDYSLFSDKLVYSLQPDEIRSSISSMEVVRIILNELQFPPIFVGLNAIIKAALLSSEETAAHMREILKSARENFHLFETIYTSFSSNEVFRDQFNRAVDSYLLVKQLWNTEIPRTSDHYGDAPRKRKIDDERVAQELLAAEPYNRQLYAYFFPKPPVLAPQATHRNNQNLQHQAGHYPIEYDTAVEARENCKRQISKILRDKLPRKNIRDGHMLYTSCCRNGHQMCVGCAMDRQNHPANAIPDCPMCEEDFKVDIFDSGDRKSGNMFLGPALYLKFFKFRVPFYITVTAGVYDRFNPALSQMLISEDGSLMSEGAISEVNSFAQQDDALSLITGGKTSGEVVLAPQEGRLRNADYVNEFDVQCHENAKVRVNLYTACTVMQGNFTLHVRLSYSPLRFTRQDQMVQGKWQQVGVPQSSEASFELDGNAHPIMDDSQFVFQRWNTRMEIQFRDAGGSVIQAAVVNIDKRPRCSWAGDHTTPTESRSCTIEQEPSPIERGHQRHRW